MAIQLIEARGHTSRDGKLELSLDLGIPDMDVSVTVRVTPTCEAAGKGWPPGFFETVAGSMPDLERPVQDEFEQRTPLE